MTARVDGQPWAAHELSVAAIPGQSGSFTITGAETTGSITRSINLLMYNIRGTGTYALGVTSFVVGGRAQFAESGVVWATPSTGAAGSVTITTLTPTRIVGTFEYTAELSLGSSPTTSHTITQGAFDLPMTTATGTLPAVPDNAGSIVRVTLGGSAFNAATAFATTSHMGNGLGLNANNDVRQITLTLPGVTTAGTYTLNQAAGRMIAVTGMGGGASDPNCCWGLTASDLGTVTITSVTAARLIGTFSATLQPQATSTQTQPLVMTNGTFDIGR